MASEQVQDRQQNEVPTEQAQDTRASVDKVFRELTTNAPEGSTSPEATIFIGWQIADLAEQAVRMSRRFYETQSLAYMRQQASIHPDVIKELVSEVTALRTVINEADPTLLRKAREALR